MNDWARTLTPRQHEIVRLVALGRSLSGAARKLGISYATAKFHLVGAHRKARCVSRGHLAAMAAIAGVVTPAEIEAARYAEVPA